MNPSNISPDDPRLTLYALGEMTPAECAEFERLLQTDAAARQAVTEIRSTAASLTAALDSESSAEVQAPAAKSGGRILRFPQMYYLISGLAAACFAVFFVLWQEKHQLQPGGFIAGPPQAGSATTRKKESPVAESKTVAEAGNLQREVHVTLALPAAEAAPVASADQAVAANQAAAVSRLDATEKSLASPALAKASLTQKDTFGGAAPRWQSPPPPAMNDEAYGYHKDNAYVRVGDQPLSTFSVDVDTASYANVRRLLAQGQRPPVDAVRIEELVNYFPYNYAPPTGPVPFAASLEVAGAPWAPEHRLVRIGLKGREVSDAARPLANLVFLLDVSGSMNEPNKLPLVKQSMRLLVNKLRPDDRVAIAVYAGASGLALPSTPVSRKAEILDAIDRLEAAGSTNGALGIQLAYDIAKANFIAGGVNRIILATDGDFNVGVTDRDKLGRLVEEKARSGVFLSVLGFGMGNLKDHTLEQLADRGNGNYAYIDTLAEAKKSLVEQAGGTLVTIAKDVKIQVEFNPAQVRAYRLIGYENRLLAKEDFNNDQVDAGEIGAGHTVTALYEVVPVGAEWPADNPAVDALKYQEPGAGSREQGAGRMEQGAWSKEQGARQTEAKHHGEVAASSPKNPDSSAQTQELLTVKIRYKEPAGDVSSKLEFPLRDTGARFEEASPDFKFAAAVAGFGMALRESPHRGAATLASVAEWGRAGTGSDAGGYRNEFLALVEQARQVVQ